MSNMETTAGSRGAELCSSPCNLCPRNCQALREKGQTGYCGVGEQIRVARAALHMWEEPCISGKAVPEQYFSAAVISDVFTVRIMK